jgi:hypothetical protein
MGERSRLPPRIAATESVSNLRYHLPELYKPLESES